MPNIKIEKDSLSRQGQRKQHLPMKPASTGKDAANSRVTIGGAVLVFVCSRVGVYVGVSLPRLNMHKEFSEPDDSSRLYGVPQEWAAISQAPKNHNLAIPCYTLLYNAMLCSACTIPISVMILFGYWRRVDKRMWMYIMHSSSL